MLQSNVHIHLLASGTILKGMHNAWSTCSEPGKNCDNVTSYPEHNSVFFTSKKTDNILYVRIAFYQMCSKYIPPLTSLQDMIGK